MDIVTPEDITDGLKRVGVFSGSNVLVHSSLSSFGNVFGGADTVIDALLDGVGAEGIVAMPTHTWGMVNARQPVFHTRLTPSIVGAITERFRQRKDAVRSRHPTHSVAAIGREAMTFTQDHECWDTPCAIESPYGRLVQGKGYVLLLGVTLDVCTLFHGFEEWAHVPWLFDRTETLYTVTDSGEILTVPSHRHTEHPNFARDYQRLEELLVANGLVRKTTIGNAEIRLIDAQGAADTMVPLLSAQPDAVLARTH